MHFFSSLYLNDKKNAWEKCPKIPYGNNLKILFWYLLQNGKNQKKRKIGFQDFWAGHFFGHLFLSIFKNLGRLSHTFFLLIQ